MKDKLRDVDITSYQWVSTKNIWADGLTKEMSMTEGMRNLLKQGACKMVPQDINKVICKNDEIKMLNIRNRKTSNKVHWISKNQEIVETNAAAVINTSSNTDVGHCNYIYQELLLYFTLYQLLIPTFSLLYDNSLT